MLFSLPNSVNTVFIKKREMIKFTLDKIVKNSNAKKYSNKAEEKL